jgi:hypothetical protein
VTFKEVQHLLESQPDYSSSQQSEMLQRLRGKPFYLWDSALHKEKGRTHRGDCCFNDIIGLPKKNGKRHPLYDYERTLYMALTRPGYLNSLPAHPRSNTSSGSRSRYSYDSLSQYSRDLMSVLHPFKEKHLWVKKAIGLGVTEFMLRFIAWLCVRDDRCIGSQMVIVTGPNQELAIKLIKRMKGLFADKLGVILIIRKQS